MLQDFNFPNTVRPLVAFEGTRVGARILPHRDDPTKLVLKAPDREAAAMLAQLAGVEPGPTTEGRYFFMVTVPKAEFLAGLGGVIAKALLQAEPTKVAPVVEAATEAGPDEEEDDDGGDE